jgi:hypothetical protein
MKTIILTLLLIVLAAASLHAAVIYFESSVNVGTSSTSVVSSPGLSPGETSPPCPPGQTIHYTTNGVDPVCQLP